MGKAKHNNEKHNKEGGDGSLSRANTSCYVQVLGLGTDTGDTTPSVLLFFDHFRYLFNVGEGFQRFCVQHKIKLVKTSGVMLTRVSTQAGGGLPGMLLTMADTSMGGLLAGHTALSLFGPPGLTTMTNAIRTYVNTRDVGLGVSEFGAAPATDAAQGGKPASGLVPIVSNSVVTITPLVLYPSEAAAAGGEAETSGMPAVAEGDAAGAPDPEGQPAGAAAEGEPQAKRQRLQNGAAARGGGALQDGEVVSGAGEGPAACYVCRLAAIPGKFLLAKAAALGIPRGPLYGRLVKGETVTLADGRVVAPHEVMEAETPGPLALILDCPSPAYLPALLHHPDLQPLLQQGGAEVPAEQAAVVVHLAPAAVAALPAYQAWLRRFGPAAQHLLVNAAACAGSTVMTSSTTIQAKLNMIDPDVFPLPSTTLAHVDSAATAAAAAAAAGQTQAENAVAGNNLLRFWLRPVARQGLDAGEVQKPLDVAAVQAELAAAQPEVLQAAEAGRQRQEADAAAAPPAVREAGPSDLEVVFLGTGAAIPGKYRNVTGIYVNLFDKGGLMLDCGEGSYGQLIRRYGSDGVAKVLQGLRLVWISHIHADHHAGLPRLLNARHHLLGPGCEPVVVMGPRPLRRALQAYARLEPMAFRYIDTAHTLPPQQPPTAGQPAPAGAAADGIADVVAAVTAALGLARLESVRVKHCAHAYGCVLEGRAGWKVAFSGDTRPCDALVQAAKDATLLIHEATFDDTMEAEALAKMHSMTREAVDCGARAGAYRTILTHFSQRYAKIPVIDASFRDSTCIAFDLMSVNLQALPRLPRQVGALQLLFKEGEEGGEEAEPVPQML